MNLYDVAYGFGLAVSAPYWLIRPSARQKVLGAMRQRRGQISPRAGGGPAILVHAVSLGEMNATRQLVAILQRERPDLKFVISTTTETGFERGRELYGSSPAVTLIRYPLDFSRSVRRTLDAIDVKVAVLMELELWPNFIKECERRGIRVVLVNGRITESSFRGYKRIRPIVSAMLARLSAVCVQDQIYAGRFLNLGASQGRTLITGTMKFDTAQVSDEVEGAIALAQAVGLRPGMEPIWVCGSTGPGEEEIILSVYRELLMRFPRLRLVIVPRHPQRFDEVAELIEQHRFRVVRRSQHTGLVDHEAPIPPVVLGDSMGELRKFYAIAHVVFVGRTLVDLGPRQHGSDMIEPAALGRPTIVGPYTSNFAEAMNSFRAARAIEEVKDEAGLRDAVAAALVNREAAVQMGRRAVIVVVGEQGATERNAQVILSQLRVAEGTVPAARPAAATITMFPSEQPAMQEEFAGEEVVAPPSAPAVSSESPTPPAPPRVERPLTPHPWDALATSPRPRDDDEEDLI